MLTLLPLDPEEPTGTSGDLFVDDPLVPVELPVGDVLLVPVDLFPVGDVLLVGDILPVDLLPVELLVGDVLLVPLDPLVPVDLLVGDLLVKLLGSYVGTLGIPNEDAIFLSIEDSVLRCPFPLPDILLFIQKKTYYYINIIIVYV